MRKVSINNIIASILVFSMFFSLILTTQVSAISSFESEMNVQRIQMQVDDQQIEYRIEEFDNRTEVTYFNQGQFNKTVMDKQSGTVEVNGQVITDNVVSLESKDNESEKNSNIITTRAAQRKVLTKTIKGTINVQNKAQLISAILALASGGVFTWAAAASLAALVISQKVKKVYYTQYIYRMKNNSPKGKYKYVSTLKFYKDSARTKHIGTIG